jgi:uncharacterized phage protein (TIGR01671 family)
MKEIKFRAWDKENNYMFEVKQINVGINIGDICKMIIWEENEEDNRADGNYLVEHSGDTIELMQFTGLTDKNGKEIYEGDIVRGEHLIGEWTAKVDMIPTGVWFGGARFTEVATPEVIGNIYENPELLKN